MFTGAVAPDFSNQVHDFNPGIKPSGLFWTLPLPSDAISVDLDDDHARMHARNLHLPDFFNAPNSLTGGAVSGPPVAGTVSFDVRWHGVVHRFQERNRQKDFGGRYTRTHATVEWSGSNDDGDWFRSTKKTNVVWAAIGRERNGRFFP